MTAIYPDFIPKIDNHPSTDDFEVMLSADKRGEGLTAKRGFVAGEEMAKLSGVLTHEHLLHTLQVSPGMHLHDPWFTGMLLHSCAPNVSLNMAKGRMICRSPIRAGDWLTMDYATTEAVLFRQFYCRCGANSCRGWVHGYAECSSWRESSVMETVGV